MIALCIHSYEINSIVEKSPSVKGRWGMERVVERGCHCEKSYVWGKSSVKTTKSLPCDCFNIFPCCTNLFIIFTCTHTRTLMQINTLSLTHTHTSIHIYLFLCILHCFMKIVYYYFHFIFHIHTDYNKSRDNNNSHDF